MAKYAYHMESEWQTKTFNTPEEVDRYLFTEGDAMAASIGGKRLEARLILQETGFQPQCSMDGTIVSVSEYIRAFPKEMKEDGPILPVYWDGPGEWEEEHDN